MPGVLLPFGTHKYMINANVKGIFLQLPVYEGSRDFLAFLWHEDQKAEPAVYVNTCHVFGATCLPLIATHRAMKTVRGVNKRLVKVVEQNVYVNNYYGGGEEVKEVVDKFYDVCDTMKLSSLHLGKVMSNSKEILANFPDKEKGSKFRQIDAKDSQSLPLMKTLGLRGDCEKHVLCFSTRATARTPKSGSEVLSQLASTYDPLQTVGLCLMMGKLLLLQFWRHVDDWKKPLIIKQQERWMQWMTGLAEIEVLHVPRW
jgi:hypothetical protein